MINDTTAGRWLKRVIWLGIFANLALALPTIAAPDMLIEFCASPPPRPCCGRALPACCWSSSASSTRPRPPTSTATASSPGSPSAAAPPACSSSCRRPPTGCSGCSIWCSWCRSCCCSSSPFNSTTGAVAARSPRGRGVMRPSWRFCAASRSRCSSSAARRRRCSSTSGSSARSRRRTSRRDEDHFLFGSIGTEGAEGRAVLALAGAAAGLSGPAAHAGRLCLARVSSPRTATRCRSASRRSRSGFPRVGINCAMCHVASYRTRPDEPPTIVAAGASHQTSPQQYFRFLFNAAGRSALQRRYAARGDLTQHPAVAHRSPAVSLRDHSDVPPGAAATARLAGQLDAARGPTGVGAGSTPSIR